MEKITYDANSTSRFKIIKRHELKWIKLLQTPYPLGFNDNIYHEGNLSKMPDFDVFSLLEFRKRTARSHGIKKNGNCKRKSRVQKLANCTLRDLATKLDVHGRHCMLSYLSSLPISVLRSLDTEANKFFGRPQTSSSPPVIFIAGRPKAALLFWFFGDFRCGALLFMVIHVIYKYKNK